MDNDKNAAKKAIEVPGMDEMLEAGVHFGHKTSKWNAKMAPYVFTSRNGVHIIDLEKTWKKLQEALEFLKSVKDKKGVILFVGTKVAAKELIGETAKACKMPYVIERWIGGTFTNFEVISQRLKHFRELEEKKKSGELKKYTKKEQHDFGIELQRLEQRFGGIKKMTKLPEAVFIVDVHKEKTVIREALTKKIPAVGICDTNANPELVKYAIPANDDALSSLRLILGAVTKVLKS